MDYSLMLIVITIFILYAIVLNIIVKIRIKGMEASVKTKVLLTDAMNYVGVRMILDSVYGEKKNKDRDKIIEELGNLNKITRTLVKPKSVLKREAKSQYFGDLGIVKGTKRKKKC